jgi:hypothetical protein
VGGGFGVPMNGMENTPARKRRLARRRRDEEAAWAARSGPVRTLGGNEAEGRGAAATEEPVPESKAPGGDIPVP